MAPSSFAAALHQEDVHPLQVQFGVILREDVPLEFGNRAGQFHARGAAAHHHVVEQPFLDAQVVGEHGLFHVLENLAAHVEGLRHLLEREALLDEFVVAEVVGARPRAEHQHVVADVADGGLHAVLLRHDPVDEGHAEVEVLFVVEDLAQGGGNGVGFEAGRCHLVEQRLERMVVVPVEHHQLEVLVAEGLHELGAARSRPR
jgi:hypothetical protein